MAQGSDTPPLTSGRRQQAARNDTVILTAAREVFLEDPKAPVAAVAERAAVGMSALYRRYPGKEDLLRQLCHDGLRVFNAEAEAAAADPDDWNAFTTFIQRVVDADVHSLTTHLAGTFTPTADMHADAQRSGPLVAALFARARASGRLRDDVVVQDVELLLEACAGIRLPDPDRTRQLRQRYLAMAIAGLTGHAPPLPGPPPQPGEFGWRWRRRPSDGQAPARKVQ